MKQPGPRHTLHRATALAVSALIGLATGLVPVTAWAEPAGCDHDVYFVLDSQPDGYLMRGGGSGHCATATSRTFRAEIKQDIALQPDPVVSANSTNGSLTDYQVETQSCDHGNVKDYYGRTFFTSSPTYKDSYHLRVATCG